MGARDSLQQHPAPVRPPPPAQASGGGRGGPPPGGPGDGSPSARMRRLQDWFDGRIALSRREAHELLEAAVASGELVREKPHFIAAIKALAAGPKSWGAMGYRLLN